MSLIRSTGDTMPETQDAVENLVASVAMETGDLVANPGADPTNGLSAVEHRRRIAQYGYNEIPEKKPSPFLNFARKFSGPTAWMLEAVIVLSLVLGNYANVYIIVALLVLNAVLGFFLEQKASKAVDALRQRLRVNARVLRDGSWLVVPARDLVPGDIVRIRAGDFVPADLQVLDGKLAVDQSSLTGESLPMEKAPSSLLFSGSVIRSGEATGLVLLTGARTYYGKTTELVQFARPRLQAEEVTVRVVKWLFVIVGLSLSAAFVVALVSGMHLVDILSLALVLLASAIPVALPAMFTITLALGSVELSRRGVLVTRLNAAEDAATMDTLCTDKTGTITTNRLTITCILPGDGWSEADVILYGALASEAANHDPIDRAFLLTAEERGAPQDRYTRRSFVPFDPATRRTEAVVEKDGTTLRVAKGAIVAIAELTGTDPARLREQSGGWAEKGYRTLAVAAGAGDDPLSVVGIVAMQDLPRPDARHLVGELKNLGISVKMLTGDALPIAQETARQVGLAGTITGAEEFEKIKEADPARASALIEESAGFARVYPEDKYAIVKSLQAQGHIVGMTGDGINDAPPLRQAEVGIAVASATDVAKGAASVVLTGEGLENIVDLVLVGRMMHQRILTWIFNKVVKTFQVVVFVVVAFLLTGQFVISVFGVVLLLFVIDFVTLSLSTDNVRGSKHPDSWEITGLVRSSLVMGVLVVIESLLILNVGRGPFGLAATTSGLQSFAFAILFYFGIMTVFVVRERGHFWDSAPSLPLLLVSLADMGIVAVLLTVGIPGLVPIPPAATLIVIAMAAFFSFGINDTIKYLMLKRWW